MSANSVTPAVLFPVNKGIKVFEEEQFGPVVPVVSFSVSKTAIAEIEESNYGQQVSLFGNDSGKLSKLIDSLINLVCRININSTCQRGPDVFPFTGRKDSAVNTLSVSNALTRFAIPSFVSLKASEENDKILDEILKRDNCTSVNNMDGTEHEEESNPLKKLLNW